MGLIPLNKDDFIARLKGLVILRGWTKVSNERLATVFQAYKIHLFVKEDLDIALELIKSQDYFDERQLVSAMVDSKNQRVGADEREEWGRWYAERRKEQKPDRKECTGNRQCDKCPRDYCHIIGRQGMQIIQVFSKIGALEMEDRSREVGREEYNMTREIAQFHEKYPGLKKLEE